MSLLIAIKAGGVLDVVLRRIPVVDGGAGSGGGGFGGSSCSGGGRGWEDAGRAECVCPSSISYEEGLISNYTLHKESIVG